MLCFFFIYCSNDVTRNVGNRHQYIAAFVSYNEHTCILWSCSNNILSLSRTAISHRPNIGYVKGWECICLNCSLAYTTQKRNSSTLKRWNLRILTALLLALVQWLVNAWTRHFFNVTNTYILNNTNDTWSGTQPISDLCVYYTTGTL